MKRFDPPVTRTWRAAKAAFVAVISCSGSAIVNRLRSRGRLRSGRLRSASPAVVLGFQELRGVTNPGQLYWQALESKRLLGLRRGTSVEARGSSTGTRAVGKRSTTYHGVHGRHRAGHSSQHHRKFLRQQIRFAATVKPARASSRSVTAGSRCSTGTTALHDTDAIAVPASRRASKHHLQTLYDPKKIPGGLKLGQQIPRVPRRAPPLD